VHDAAGGGPHSKSPFKSHKAPDERDEQDGAVAVSGVEASAPLKCTPNPMASPESVVQGLEPSSCAIISHPQPYHSCQGA